VALLTNGLVETRIFSEETKMVDPKGDPALTCEEEETGRMSLSAPLTSDGAIPAVEVTVRFPENSVHFVYFLA